MPRVQLIGIEGRGGGHQRQGLAQADEMKRVDRDRNHRHQRTGGCGTTGGAAVGLAHFTFASLTRLGFEHVYYTTKVTGHDKQRRPELWMTLGEGRPVQD